jgi:predicted nucleic acid-binding protein
MSNKGNCMEYKWISTLIDQIVYGKPSNVYQSLMDQEEGISFSVEKRKEIQKRLQEQKRISTLRKKADAESIRLAGLSKVVA